MSQAVFKGHDFILAYYSGDREAGSLKVLTQQADRTAIHAVPTAAASGLDKNLKPVLLGVTPQGEAVLLNPRSKTLTIATEFPADSFAAHVYSDPYSNRDWFMNDGDKETGNDTLNCGNNGSSVTVVENANNREAKYLATICVGRGHHQAAFTAPSAQHPSVPRRAIISNLKDGTLSFIGNDPTDASTYLKVLSTLNLCEPDKEQGLAADAVPNNAFPHGLVYSPVTGKVYNLNNGYGTVVVIDPHTGKIEDRFAFKGHSNLFITPDGKYLFGRGADRKSDAAHVIAKLTVMDLAKKEIVSKMDLKDIYISKYFFNHDASKLYLTTGSSGSPEQQANVKSNVVLVFDLTALPNLKQVAEITIGSVGTLAFYAGNGAAFAFCSDSDSGALKVIDDHQSLLVHSVAITQDLGHSRVWMLR